MYNSVASIFFSKCSWKGSVLLTCETYVAGKRQIKMFVVVAAGR